jgi:hypothetical protein
MIEIHPERKKDKLQELYSTANITMTDSSIAIVAADGDEVLGSCLFDLGYSVIIHDITPKDDVAFADGLLRSALHVGVENGVMTAFYSDTAPENLIKNLGFIKNADTKELDVEKLFKSCCSCEK